MTRATVRRFLLTLVREGYVETDGKYFSLRPKVLELGFSVLSSMNIWDVAQPIMNDLSNQLQESCFAAILDHDSVIYVARANSNRLVNVGINIGSRVPAHCVSTGRVLLAALSDEALHAYLDKATLAKFTPNTVTSKVRLRGLIEEARRQGWATGDQELEVGLRSISVPIPTGRARSSRRSTVLPKFAHHAGGDADEGFDVAARRVAAHYARVAGLTGRRIHRRSAPIPLMVRCRPEAGLEPRTTVVSGASRKRWRGGGAWFEARCTRTSPWGPWMGSMTVRAAARYLPLSSSHGLTMGSIP